MEQNIRERLDRGVANNAWLQQFPKFSLRHLPHSVSDHCPLFIETEEISRRSSDRFRFEALWVGEKSCEAEIKRLWEGSFGSFVSRMKSLADGLKIWGKRIRNERGRGVKRLNRKLEELNCGEKDGQIVSKSKEIENIAQVYFSDLFTTRGIGDLNHILSGINHCVSDNMNQALVASYKEVEIVEALKGMGPTKASKADGFPAIFYQKFWYIIGKDVCDFCLDILNNGYSLKDI
ncbi:hypothetical protein J1N35_037157 [Gossypium stocksii]|uniref:Reverse transcriptase n=1 Tax=Gossypium stocksii TaxID=47602 RepID=A0A9D3UJP3_9ROSI|nr:hypothetical protein J1N35_037157 [Gossypium stocksii]